MMKSNDIDTERKIPLREGRNRLHEKYWGWIGGIVGALAGISSAIIAVCFDGASWIEKTSPYPQVFTQHNIINYDLFLIILLIVGVGFSVVGLYCAKRSYFPRTNAFGANLIGLILMSLAGSMLFLRVIALIQSV